MTTTMAEPFDTTMTDSGDIDVSMYAGGMATADSWLSTEGDIEIDMLDDDEAITEYEMADDGEGYENPELQDVEVLDVSRAPSLPPAEDAEVAVDANTEDIGILPIPSSDAAPYAHPSLESVADPSAGYAASESAPLPEVNFAETDVLGQHLAAHEESAPPAAESSDISSAPGLATGAADGGASAEPPLSSHAQHSDVAAANGDHQAAIEPHRSSEPYSAGPAVHDHVDTGDDHASAADHAAHLDTHATQEPTAEDAADLGDPHEISEGVYIDPPPPVLLSLPPSAERAECCLFNHPQSSTPTSPSGNSKSEGGAEQPQLLLHDRPTLYYEPVSSVFEALRHQECIQNLPGCAEAELVLDAYELQLAISEDNLYAHEVSLHELNVIHDGSDLHGPLRLRLKRIAPRFVTRYQILREQIARLDLTADGDVSHPDLAASHAQDQYAEGTNELAGADAQYSAEEGRAGEASHDAPEEHADRQQSEDHEGADRDNQHAGSSVPDHFEGTSDAPDHQAAADSVSEREHRTDLADEEAEIASSAARETVGRETREGAESEPEEEGLDANAVHEQADAGEGGDYVDHDEFPDDEDEFGEDLPEDLGGETRNSAYIHTGAVEDGAEDALYAEDQAADPRGGVLSTPHDILEQDEFPDAAQSEGVEDQHPEAHEDGLNNEERTDFPANLNSSHGSEEYHEEGGDYVEPEHEEQESRSVTQPQGESVKDSEADDRAQEESTTLSSEDEDGLLEDWDDGEDISAPAEPAAQAEHLDALSRKSSTTTLASKTSKRTYDEVELDDFDDDPSLLDAASSPETKRLRVQ
ncbi:hypothetical protein OH77DRAFT_1507632 [Trametes cingulata]|nr:hypothetical protein OH77DRAFT_1507632 [Trametes cingulata]